MERRKMQPNNNHCAQLHAAYDRLADAHRASVSNFEVRIKLAESKTRQLYQTKLDRCEHERTRVYQVILCYL